MHIFKVGSTQVPISRRPPGAPAHHDVTAGGRDGPAPEKPANCGQALPTPQRLTNKTGLCGDHKCCRKKMRENVKVSDNDGGGEPATEQWAHLLGLPRDKAFQRGKYGPFE